MSTGSVAEHRRDDPTRGDRWRAIQERTTRGLLTFNAGGVVCLEGDLWAVRSATHGGFHRVDLTDETCTCEDFVHYGRAHEVNCRHIYAVAIAHATRRRHRPCACIDGTVYLTVEDDGQERVEAVQCRRCNS